MLTQYKNINEIKAATKSISATRLESTKANLLSHKIDVSVLNNNTTEIHFYSGDSWVTGNHQVNINNAIPDYQNLILNRNLQLRGEPVAIDLNNELNSLNIKSGKFTTVVNFFKNLIGNYNEQYLRIDDISPDRTEIRLRAIDDTNPKFLTDITNYINTVKHIREPFFKTYLLNFSRNKTAMFVNSVVIGDYIYVKLYEPLPSEYSINYKCWVVEELKQPYVDHISIVLDEITKQFKTLANPNWYATDKSVIASAGTELKSWNDLLGSSVQTSQQIIDSYFSGSLAGMNLNIDYSDFNNFIFYSSATERVENFKYKLELLEFYTSQSLTISQLSGSVATTNALDYQTNRTNLISGFDTFEQFLYYNSSSKLTTYDLEKEFANVAELTGSYIQPVPKTNSSVPYTLYSVNSNEFKLWYSELYSNAVTYDTYNNNSLTKAIPEYIRYDENNDQLFIFVNMLGHHYDILYTYINNMTQINKREENPKLGMPNELLYSVAKQFGWNLQNGNQYTELWQYVLGTSEAGIPLTGSNTVGDPSVPGRDMTYTVWRRIVNNLPLLLKSKGTKRSIQALLSCYGIPNSMININEYGGPRLDRAPIYEKLNFDYALDLINNSAGTVTVNYSQSINTVELRFRTDNVVTNPLLPSTMNLFSVGNNHVTLDYTRGTLGTIQINGTSSADIELFDGGWLTVMLKTNGSNLTVVAKKSKYGKIVAAVSASATTSFVVSGSVVLGGTSTGASRLTGQLQELRLWSSSLEDSAFNNHVKAPAAYDGNLDAYDELVFRLPLTQKINHSTTSSLSGVEPNLSNISASFNGWSSSTPYDSIEETYYYDSISLGTGTYDDNKVRIEENELIGTLDIKTRAERSQFDKAPLDSNKLGVYFSPQTMIDEDIIAQLGFTSLDDFIGDPGNTDPSEYPILIQQAQSYWKKYADKNDINSYIKIFTLFDLSFFKQLEQLLPARVNAITGIVIQPNILERSKFDILPIVSNLDVSYEISIEATTTLSSSANYLNFIGSVDSNIMSVSAINDDQWQSYLTASADDRYNSVEYSHQSLIRSGSVYITASTPYWMSEVLSPSITGSAVSEFSFTQISTTYSSSANSMWVGTYSQRQDYLPAGINNQRYNGAHMMSLDFNINSADTIDGGPVVEWTTANGNQLVYQTPNNTQGSFIIL
jgi:hypothetical protein